MLCSGEQLFLAQRSESAGYLLPGQGGANMEHQPEHCGVTKHLLLHYQVLSSWIICVLSIESLLMLIV